MEYEGKLYGKVGRSYFPLESTTKDFDQLKAENTDLKAEIQKDAVLKIAILEENEKLKERVKELESGISNAFNTILHGFSNDAKVELEQLLTNKG